MTQGIGYLTDVQNSLFFPPLDISRNYITHEPVIINFLDNFTDYGFSGTGIPADPFIIENLNITTENDGICFFPQDTQLNNIHLIIQNCLIKARNAGMLLRGDILDEEGIPLGMFSGHIEVRNNILKNYNYQGITITNIRNSIVSGNICNGTWDSKTGIELFYAGSSTLSNNTCYFHMSEGISLTNSDDCQVFNNTCSDNVYGLRVIINSSNYPNFTGLGSHFYDNYFLGHGGAGILMQDGYTIDIIYHNYFISDLCDTPQAFDGSPGNYWYEPNLLEGNYWSDLGDKCYYIINGEDQVYDLYPLNKIENCVDPINPTTDPQNGNGDGFPKLAIIALAVCGIVTVVPGIIFFLVWRDRKKVKPAITPVAQTPIQPQAIQNIESEVKKEVTRTICRNCGSEVDEGFKFCQNCGQTL